MSNYIQKFNFIPGLVSEILQLKIAHWSNGFWIGTKELDVSHTILSKLQKFHLRTVLGTFWTLLINQDFFPKIGLPYFSYFMMI